jgi:hypothetical protein
VGRALWLYRRLTTQRRRYTTFRDSHGWLISVDNEDLVDYMAAEHFKADEALEPEDVLTGKTPLVWTINVRQMRNLFKMAQDCETADQFLLILAAHTPAPDDRAKVEELRKFYGKGDDDDE